MSFKGTIIEESLQDNRIINDFTITNVRISSADKPGDRWHLYSVELDDNQIDSVAQQLKPSGWYAHFWNETNIIAVFPNRKFIMSRFDKNTWNDAIQYGLQIGIPAEQLDFLIAE